MRRILGMVGVVCAVAVAGVARGQITTAPNYVLTTIDAIARRAQYQVLLTGVQAGAAAPSEVRLESSSSLNSFENLDACERFATTMMAKPGQYKLEVWLTANSYCRLTKLNP